MPVESAADRAVFTSPADFGDVATYTLAGGGSKEIEGIYDGPHIDIDFGGEATTSDRRPTFCCAAADLPAGASGGDEGDSLALPGETFKVIDLKFDGQGMVLVILGS